MKELKAAINTVSHPANKISAWNPVKELKVDHAGVLSQIDPVESGEGIESCARYHASASKAREVESGEGIERNALVYIPA